MAFKQRRTQHELEQPNKAATKGRVSEELREVRIGKNQPESHRQDGLKQGNENGEEHSREWEDLRVASRAHRK